MINQTIRKHCTQESVKLCIHHSITVEILATSVGVSEEEIRAHLTYMPCLLEVSDIADWVRILFATLWIPRGRSSIQFMFSGESHPAD